jgi:hypothetical protein
MSAVVHIVAVISVIDEDIVVIVPIVRPVLGPGVLKRHPVALILEARVSAILSKRQAGDPEPMLWAEVAAITVLGNPVAAVPAALLPAAVIRPPVPGTMFLPGTLPNALLVLITIRSLTLPSIALLPIRVLPLLIPLLLPALILSLLLSLSLLLLPVLILHLLNALFLLSTPILILLLSCLMLLPILILLLLLMSPVLVLRLLTMLIIMPVLLLRFLLLLVLLILLVVLCISGKSDS